MGAIDEIPVFITKRGIDAVFDLISHRDMDAFEIARISNYGRHSIKYYLAELCNSGRIFRYPHNPDKRNSRFVYTVDESKGMDDTEPEPRPKGTIPGARVYLIDDKKREAKLKEIARSQRTKSRAVSYPGTSWVHMEMAL